MSQTFNFYEFLKDATNQSLVFLQDNPQYDDVLRALSDMFEKLYTRVQDIKVTNSLDIDGSNDFQKYLNDNDGTVVSEFVLEYAAKYLDTDHFKDTIALLMRQFKEREVGGEIPNLDEFISDEIIPSFKFFTMNAGDLHKSKGVKSLIERIFEFYSPASSYEKMFDGVVEWDTEDKYDKRINNFSSYRVGISGEILLGNYEFPSANNIIKFIELSNHKLVLTSENVFISKKEREDWWIVDAADDLFKIDDDWFAIKQGTTLLFYKDDVEIYNSNYEYVTPTPEDVYENVEWTPTVINIKDSLNQYQNHNLYFVEKIANEDTFVDFEYNLIRFHSDSIRGTYKFQEIKHGLGISYDELAYSGRVDYPKIIQYISLDYIWIDLYDDGDDEYVFDSVDTKLVYSYVAEFQHKQPDGLGGFVYPVNKFLLVARDGYNYDPITNGFYYNIVEKLDNDIVDKYVLQERVLTSILDEELKRSTSSELSEIETVFDLFVPMEENISEYSYYNMQGYWDVSSGAEPTYSELNHGDYWLVDVAGDFNLNGLTNWKIDDVIVWNGNFNHWEKNNEILDLTDAVVSNYKLGHTLIALDKREFDYVDENDNSMVTPFEQSGGMYMIKLSDIDLNISSFSNLISSDTNAIETFGDDPFVLYSYTDKDDGRVKIIIIPMNTFSKDVIVSDITRSLDKYPYVNSKNVISDIQFTDKHIIVYASDSKNSTIGTYAIIMENMGYNLPLGIRTNVMNVKYDVDLRPLTRENQPFYRLEDENGDLIEDEEVSAFQATLKRYTPISSVSENLAAFVDMGYTDQKIEDDSAVEEIVIEVSDNVFKTLKEQSNIKMQESLILRVDGLPGDVNCNCDKQRDILYVTDYEAMTIFYDVVGRIPDPNIIDAPEKVVLNKIGETNDIYSKLEDVCRWESDWFEYLYDDGTTIPMRVRTKMRLNLYSSLQSFIPWGSNDSLIYNWGMHTHVQYLVSDIEDTITNWVDAIDEEVYKNSALYDECNPIGQLYTTALIDDGSTFPMVIVDDGSTIPNLVPAEPLDPWEVYDVPAAKISLV